MLQGEIKGGGAVTTVNHYGGGVLTLATAQEREAYAMGRIESVADLLDLCASALESDNVAMHGTLRMAMHMLLEANQVLRPPS